MKRFFSVAGALLLAGMLAACGAGQGGEPAYRTAGSSAAQLSSASSESAPPDSSAPAAAIRQTGPGPQQMEELIFVQLDSGAEEGYEPTIRLLENGNFELAAFCYDGTVILSGTYSEEEDAYLLKPDATTAPEGAVGSSLAEIRLEKTEGGVRYSGDSLGVTYDGAIFVKTVG